MPERDQPGQSTAVANAFLAPASTTTSTVLVATGHGVPAEQQEGRVAAALVFDLDRRARLDVDEASVPRQLGEGGAVEPLVVDALGIGAVERAVLRVEVGQGDPATGPQQTTDRGERSRRVLDVMQHEERHGEVECVVRRRIGHEVELDRRHLRQVRGRELVGDDRQHPIGRLGQDELSDVVKKGEPEQPRPGTDVDDPVRSREIDVRPDRSGSFGRARDPLRRVPILRLLVEGAHDWE